MAKSKSKNPDASFGKQLILFRYFLDLFGKDSMSAFSGELNSAEYEGVSESGNTRFWAYLDGIVERRGGMARISRGALKAYDENIVSHVRQIGAGRGGINLKYFQYIACLFTEMYLDRYFADAGGFAADLNDYAGRVKAESGGLTDIAPFRPDNMNKLAFMCATGSGKTLIMHVNIFQFRHYLKKAQALKPGIKLNKIIVLAPNKGMSEQHLSELALSHISSKPFSKDGFAGKTDVLVIDMNKLKEEGKIKTISVDSFEGNNLVLVDEAHRGLAGDVWYDYRSRLSSDSGKGGFAFEYSATLKQAMRSGKPSSTSGGEWKKRLDEYFRAIIADYSYKFFYEDGYGKEYKIYNLRGNIAEEQRQLYLTGCLLSFYQQLKLFEEKGKELFAFRVEKPLLVFAGNRVTAATSKGEMTDIEEVLDFIDRFVKNKEQSIGRIHSVLNDDEWLLDSRGKGLFNNTFHALAALFGKMPDGGDVYADMLSVLFNGSADSAAPRLHVVNLRRVSGEIALRIGGGEYFGVISIGDTTGLMKIMESKGIMTGNDEFLPESLFGGVNARGSNIKILIGSRKFSEGWNSWRVSTMGLINFAKGEGSQAIQLFGRGVRLRGYGGSLKRSSKLNGIAPVPKNIGVLETLAIFGIKAQYMEDFRKYLELEDIPAEPRRYTLPVLSRYEKDKHSKLRVIKVRGGADFKKQAARLVLSAPDSGFASYLRRSKAVIDCRSKVQSLESVGGAQLQAVPEEHTLDREYLPWLDYERIAYELELYKNEKSFYNISILKPALQGILAFEGWYSLLIPKRHIEVKSAERLHLAADFAIMALKSYLDKFYKYQKDKWEAPLLEYQELSPGDGNFIDKYSFSYTDEDGAPDAEAVEGFVEDLKEQLNRKGGLAEEKGVLGGSLAAFDLRAHLYAPLIFLHPDNSRLSVSPAGLNKDEKRFADLLREHLDLHGHDFTGKELYLLRNKSKAGMGFFEAANFYPDYVLWIDTPDVQYISFIDPKGLRMLQWTDPKVEFCKTIKDLEARLQPTSPDKRIVLNSFLMSGTPYADLYQWWGKTRAELRAKNIFCLDDADCISGMFAKISAF